MPRSQIKGSQIMDLSITDCELAVDAVTTEKIRDKNVTLPKLGDDVVERLLSVANPIGRVKLSSNITSNTNFTIPNSLTYDPPDFVERVLVYRNGQLLYNGSSPPTGDDDPTEVWPGDSNTELKFSFDLLKCDTIQVVTL